MATDYDAPRKTEDDSESIEALKERVPDKLSGSVDVEDADNPSGFELPGADLSDLELDVVVLPAAGGRVHLRELLPREAPLAARPRGRRRPYLRGVRRVACARRSAAASRSGVRDEITHVGRRVVGVGHRRRRRSRRSRLGSGATTAGRVPDLGRRWRVRAGRAPPTSPVQPTSMCARPARSTPSCTSTTGDAAIISATMPTPTSRADDEGDGRVDRREHQRRHRARRPPR